MLRRGPYVVAAVVDEGVSETPLQLKGRYVDLFDPALPVVDSYAVNPGSQALLLDLGKVADSRRPQVVAASFRESDESVGRNSYEFTAKSPVDTDGVARVLLPSAPASVLVDGVETYEPGRWDRSSRTYLLGMDNNPDGRRVRISW